MSNLYLLDTDTLSRLQLGNPSIVRRLSVTSPEQVYVSVITVEEQLNGWYNLLRQPKDDARLAQVYERISRTMEFLAQFRILTFDELAISRYRELEKQRLNIGRMDLRIGATALVHGATVVTSNVRDFSRIPGLAYEDWTLEAAD